MQLSIIIVSYNVRYFLDQAVASVLESTCTFDYEIIVVDNGSTDDSVEWMKGKYPSVRLFDLKENLGFAKANNFAARKANGDCILLLNPDTIVQSDSLQLCFDFLQSNPKAGAVGLRMYDGQGKYLPESKRGFPSPWTSFCKIAGFNELFPKSKFFNYYYLGHKSSDLDQEVDVLTGAFMMLRRDRYLALGGLDEDFFMYGEDIDLCFRLHEGGYQNYYLASSSIIHFKGESTSKQSFQYIKTFYSAMSIYAGKHYNKHFLALMSIFIQVAIYLRAGIAILFQKVSRYRAFLQQFLFILSGLLIGHVLVQGEFYLDYRFFIPPLLFAGASRVLAMKDCYWNWWTQFKAVFMVFVILLPLIISSSSALWMVSLMLALLYFILQLARRSRSAFLPRLQKEHRAAAFVKKKTYSHVEELLDRLPGYNRVENLIPIKFQKRSQPPPAEASELIFDPAFLSWSDIVTNIITYGRGRVNRILSSDESCLITSRSKNESAILVNAAYLDAKRWESVSKRKVRHEFVFSLLSLVIFPLSFLISGRQGLRKSLTVLFRRKDWFQKKSFSRSENTSDLSRKNRERISSERQYSFSKYQKKLWSDWTSLRS